MENKSILTILTVAVLMVGIGFFAGMKYEQSKQPSGSRQFNGQFGNGQGMRTGQGQGNRLGFRPVNGEIISVDEKSVTVKMQDGSSRIVLLSEKTEINKAASGTKEDLKVGERVAVFGTENADGSVMAQNIQLNPVFRDIPTPNP